VGLGASFRTVLLSHGVVSFDTMVVIYHFEDHPKYASLTQLLFEAVDRGDLLAQISVLVAGEVLTGPKKAGDQEMLLHYRHVFSSYPNLELLPATMQVMELASDLRARYNLKTPDAIHLGTALCHGARAFVTNDEQMRQVGAEGLEVLILSDFVKAG
jgi:predicted nucleic acid-binding protein